MAADVTAYLAGVRAELNVSGASDEDARRLLDAVEAALGVHPAATTANDLEVCPACTRDKSAFVPADRCLIRVAITAALLEEETTDAD